MTSILVTGVLVARVLMAGALVASSLLAGALEAISPFEGVSFRLPLLVVFSIWKIKNS